LFGNIMAEITQKEFVKFKDLIYQSCGGCQRYNPHD